MNEEISIIRRIIAGDRARFRTLVQRYQQPVISMIRNITNDHHASEDLAQDVFLAAYSSLSTFDPARSRFSTWLFTIARNKAINALQKKKPITQQLTPERIDQTTPCATLIEQEFFARLDRVLNRLPIKQKAAFVLAELQELLYRDIAQIEGVSLGTIKSRINRAKKKLRTALSVKEASLL